MPELKVLKPEPVSLRDHPEIDEAWVHHQIKEDPTILGLGELTLRDSERRQTKAGRLDILLQDPEADPPRRYELEVQLGATDESHIIRTIEYWDLERRKFPQYDHVAVIAAEDITSRFFNVIQLFNRSVPIIALKMVCLKVPDGLILHFVKVMDETAHRAEDEEDSPAADRSYWEKAASRESMVTVDSLFRVLADFNSNLVAHYTQSYIVPRMGAGNADFLWLEPKRRFVRVWVYLESVDSAKMWCDKLVPAGFETKGPDEEYGISFRLSSESLNRNQVLIKDLLKKAYEGYRP